MEKDPEIFISHCRARAAGELQMRTGNLRQPRGVPPPLLAKTQVGYNEGKPLDSRFWGVQRLDLGHIRSQGELNPPPGASEAQFVLD